MAANIDKLKSGELGFVFESGTNAVTGNFWKIKVVATATFSAITAPRITGDAFTGVALPANFEFEAPITGFTLTSGSVIAYNSGV